MDIAKISLLAKKYLDGEATVAEQQILHEWYDHVNEGETEIVSTAQPETLDNVKARMFNHLRQEIAQSKSTTRIQDKTVPVRMLPTPKRWIPWAAAAIILLSAGGLWLFQSRQQAEPIKAAVIAPGTNKARLTLANGDVVELNESAEGTIAEEAGTQVSKQRAALIYHAGTAAGKAAMNMLTVPRGGNYQVVLPDGTKVWLNAASELKYPTAFTGKERIVSITGEGYFEVAKDAAKPFIVKNNHLQVEVLGTQFNMKAYEDEQIIKTTLLEGSVKLVTSSGSSMLSPGQQAQLETDGGIKIVPVTDANQVIAWKNGFFSFRKADISTIMREISRWYDVDIKYEGTITTRRFTGKVLRSYNLSETLTILEASDLHFRLEGKQITVLP